MNYKGDKNELHNKTVINFKLTTDWLTNEHCIFQSVYTLYILVMPHSVHHQVNLLCQWNCCKSIVSQWFCYNYGESWDSSCEKSWFGLLCNQTVSLKTDSKTLYYSILKLKYSLSISKHNKGEKKYASLNNSHNNCHRNNMNGIFLQLQMFRSIDQSLHPTGCNPWII